MKQENEGLLRKIDHYWKIIPTHHTPSYSVDKMISDHKTVKVVTVSKHHENWEQIFECPNLEEINLDNPSQAQVQAMNEFGGLKRLRIKHFLAISDTKYSSTESAAS